MACDWREVGGLVSFFIVILNFIEGCCVGSSGLLGGCSGEPFSLLFLLIRITLCYHFVNTYSAFILPFKTKCVSFVQKGGKK